MTISLEQCRVLLGNYTGSTEAVAQIRDDMYFIGEVICENYVQSKGLSFSYTSPYTN